MAADCAAGAHEENPGAGGLFGELLQCQRPGNQEGAQEQRNLRDVEHKSCSHPATQLRRCRAKGQLGAAKDDGREVQ